MRAALAHRGPDDEGQWSQGPACFGFRRLSILDLSGGRQPMSSADGRLTVVFNGEIYNHPQLRSELEAAGARYRTRSDTETILHLYERYGAGALGRLRGMFAVALWDSSSAELLLARDPIGIKPLYYSAGPRELLFASELRALVAGGVSTRLDERGVWEYLLDGFVRAPRTALASVRKLPPGHLLRAGAAGVRVERFWSPPPAQTRIDDEREALERLESLLLDSVRSQMLSDVPVGAFLSGGVDSSLVAALMTRASPRPVSTFSIGFSGARPGLDESAYARTVARHLGTDHHELVLGARVLDDLERLSECLDEPVADSAMLPTLLLSRFARERVKVVLTGEGADELFAGYNRYKAALLSERIQGLPGWLRPPAAALARRLGRGRVFEGIPYSSLVDWASALRHGDAAGLRSVCAPEFFESASREPAPDGWERPGLDAALAYDLRNVLCDALLMKVDKSSMRASLEARVPFLDPGLVSFAARLHPSLKMRRFKGKYLLRRLAEKLLPRSIAWRRKHGFIVPWEEWLSRPSEATSALLSGQTLRDCGIFDLAAVGRLRGALIAGRAGDAGLLFRVAVFALWLDGIQEKAEKLIAYRRS